MDDLAGQQRLLTPRFPVYYYKEDGTLDSTDYVVPLPFRGKEGEPNLGDLILLQEELIHYAVFKSAAVGSLVCDPVGLTLLNKIAKMLKVVGQKERGINLVRMLNSGDYVQIGRIFLSERYDNEDIYPADFKPSLIAKIHRMNFEGKLRMANQELLDQARARERAQYQEQIMAIERSIETPPIETPPIEPPIEPPIQINTPLPVPVDTIST